MTIRCLEMEAKEATDRAARAETERDATQHEVAMEWLEIEAEGSTRAWVELELSLVQIALTTSEGGRLKAESELGSAQQALVAAKETYRRAEEESGR